MFVVISKMQGRWRRHSFNPPKNDTVIGSSALTDPLGRYDPIWFRDIFALSSSSVVYSVRTSLLVIKTEKGIYIEV